MDGATDCFKWCWCDFRYPEGINGDYVSFNPSENPFTVPSGKRFYLLHSGGPTTSTVIINNEYSIYNPSKDKPIIINENQQISSLNNSTSQFVNGLLVDINTSLSPVFFDLQYDGDPYIVPSEKKLILLGQKTLEMS